MRLVYKGQITPGKWERNKIRPWQACEAAAVLEVTGVCGHGHLANCNFWTWPQMHLTKEIEFHPCWEDLKVGKDNVRVSSIFVSPTVFSLFIHCHFFFLKKDKLKQTSTKVQDTMSCGTLDFVFGGRQVCHSPTTWPSTCHIAPLSLVPPHL